MYKLLMYDGLEIEISILEYLNFTDNSSFLMLKLYIVSKT